MDDKQKIYDKTKNNKKKEQLGMSFSTANYKLVKDLLFDFVSKSGIMCFRCNLPITRQTFSIEHKNIWSTSETPKETFFELANITYSHRKCNAAHTSKRKNHEWLNGDRTGRHPSKIDADNRR